MRCEGRREPCSSLCKTRAASLLPSLSLYPLPLRNENTVLNSFPLAGRRCRRLLRHERGRRGRAEWRRHRCCCCLLRRKGRRHVCGRRRPRLDALRRARLVCRIRRHRLCRAPSRRHRQRPGAPAPPRRRRRKGLAERRRRPRRVQQPASLRLPGLRHTLPFHAHPNAF
ncbi:hypothetical protein FA09DRAFT_218578 [Tilletiopsis washingtonensis]|uniref:Uncharacterized protein n=1 Tax=Tilletiopsis washingtonensis TaxID=58919 RepID=A0A316ZFT2_9BASI|nr:hypothetical protein FA09DRAFT_218578 [Tilletiopsis washingtonensis]PWN99772.1 hypothetical protein FA09DRAFT_218578 [Tilletiopsis washingtonensis]